MKLNRLISSFCTYRIELPELMQGAFFIGCCELHAVSALPDAWTYTRFAETVKPDDTVRLTIMGIFSSRPEAEGLQGSLVAVENVHVNKYSPRCEATAPRGTRGWKVRDKDNAMIYPSANVAARSIGVTSSAMSQHLAGKIPTLKGRTFERLVQE